MTTRYFSCKAKGIGASSLKTLAVNGSNTDGQAYFTIEANDDGTTVIVECDDIPAIVDTLEDIRRQHYYAKREQKPARGQQW